MKILRRAHRKLILDVKGACLEAFTNVALQTNKKYIAFEEDLVMLFLFDFSTTSVVGPTT